MHRLRPAGTGSGILSAIAHHKPGRKTTVDTSYDRNECSSVQLTACLLYTSDAADDTPCVDLGGRRIIKKNDSCKTVYTQNLTRLKALLL